MRSLSLERTVYHENRRQTAFDYPGDGGGAGSPGGTCAANGTRREVEGYRVGKWFYVDVPAFCEALKRLRVTR